MSEKQLNKDEIQQIFQFMEKNGVKYYDVQLEMVDHFASEIEQNWAHYPEHFTFEHKLLDVYSRIGQMGFNRIIQTKTSAINKWFWKYCVNYIKSFFSWPKTAITILLMVLFFQLIIQSDNPFGFGFLIIHFGVAFPIIIFLVGIYLRIYLFEKVQVLSLLTILSTWVMVILALGQIP